MISFTIERKSLDDWVTTVTDSVKTQIDEANQDLVLYFQAEIDNQFRKGDNGRWKELSPSYEEYKQRHYGDQPILIATGDMRREYLGGVEIENGEVVANMPDSAARQYPALVHEGEITPTKFVVPERSLLAISDDGRIDGFGDLAERRYTRAVEKGIK